MYRQMQVVSSFVQIVRLVYGNILVNLSIKKCMYGAIKLEQIKHIESTNSFLAI